MVSAFGCNEVYPKDTLCYDACTLITPHGEWACPLPLGVGVGHRECLPSKRTRLLQDSPPVSPSTGKWLCFGLPPLNPATTPSRPSVMHLKNAGCLPVCTGWLNIICSRSEAVPMATWPHGLFQPHSLIPKLKTAVSPKLIARKSVLGRNRKGLARRAAHG